MVSNKAEWIAALDAAADAQNAVARIPWQALTAAERRALLKRMDELDQLLAGTQRRLLATVIAESAPAQFGAGSWAEILARRLRISVGEAQRRVAEATRGPQP